MTNKVEAESKGSTATVEKTDNVYVVVRDGYRVSDRTYTNTDDPECILEILFWTKVSDNWSWGEKVELVVYDPKKHRIW